MRTVILVLAILGMLFLVGCQSQQMVLLDEKISKVNISKSNGFGEMNEDILKSFKDAKSIKTVKNSITTARKQTGKVDVSEPEYDVTIEYTSPEGKLPTHAIHLWLGKENEKSVFMYLMADEVYLTSPKMTKKLRELILSGE